MSCSVGHVRVLSAEERTCSRGGQDDVEAYASGPGIELSFAHSTGTHIGLPRIAKLAADGDTVDAAVISSAATTLGRSLATAVTIFDPSTLVVGGGVARLGDAFLAPLVDTLRHELRPPFGKVRVSASRLGTDAALVGAAAAARRLLTDGSLHG